MVKNKKTVVIITGLLPCIFTKLGDNLTNKERYSNCKLKLDVKKYSPFGKYAQWAKQTHCQVRNMETGD